MLEEKQSERALYRVSECIDYIKTFPPFPCRVFPGLLPVSSNRRSSAAHICLPMGGILSYIL
jgi:hypothetical protein